MACQKEQQAYEAAKREYQRASDALSTRFGNEQGGTVAELKRLTEARNRTEKDMNAKKKKLDACWAKAGYKPHEDL